MERMTTKRARPLSPNIQIYRPQLTSVLSIANRITGVALSVFAVVLAIWLAAAASGPAAYSQLQTIIGSWPGQILFLIATFVFFLHLCGGIRHLVWDSVRAFELKQIYASGWAVVLLSAALTVISWLLSLLIAGHS
ncbi:MAG: succinate dehydrogenase, cytochrome b556 subunit [Mesorhizobium sp.]|nr:succinate dehydrogenase, cytochrome b556 subunit [Mesorhizobium sp.]MBN9244904.1 succinate dehydrogenase, cytochrome b556 subunit [Mesorhizobium sp.]